VHRNSRYARNLRFRTPAGRIGGVVVLVAVALIACSGTSSSGTSDTPSHTAQGTTKCESVMHIGDSLTVGMMGTNQVPDPAERLDAQYRAVGVTDPRINGGIGRTIHEVSNNETAGAEVARQARANGFKGCWVVELGTNDTALLAQHGSTFDARQRIDEMMAIIGDEPVMWLSTVTLAKEGPYADKNMDAWNAVLEEERDLHPNMVVFDWAAVAQNSWFAADGIHYTPDGFREMARLTPTELAKLLPKQG
jgi:hypothetical protein